MGSTAEAGVLVGRTAPPLVELLVDKKKLDQLGPSLSSALGRAGYPPFRTAAAVKPRATSVVYAASGMEAAARLVAAAVPGGAEVQPLSWKTDAEISVAAGATAEKNPK